MSTISVVMSTYRTEDYKYKSFFNDSVESILNQTYTDFEFIIVIEFGCCISIIQAAKQYAQNDKRIKLIFNKQRLRLAESLNVGMRNAAGKYIARMDDDDIAMANRFAKQVAYMDAHPETGICGTAMIVQGKSSAKIQKVYVGSDEIRAHMLFECALAHPSVMFRRQLFLDNGWLYDKDYITEDFELWGRVIYDIKAVNLGTPLIKYRYGFENLSIQNGQRKMLEETGRVVTRNIKKYFNIDIQDYSKYIDLELCIIQNRELDSYEDIRGFIRAEIDFYTAVEEQNRKNIFVKTEILRAVMLERFIRQTFMINIETICMEAAKKTDSFIDALNMVLSDYYNNDTCDSDNQKIVDIIEKLMYLPEKSKIIIWGLGRDFRSFTERFAISRIKDRFELVALCDQSEVYKDLGIRTIRPEEIVNEEFDYVLSSTRNGYNSIENRLINELHVPREKTGIVMQMYLTLLDERNQKSDNYKDTI